MYTEHLRIPVGVGFLHVERTGRGGPPVILLHGYGTCTFLWRAIAFLNRDARDAMARKLFLASITYLPLVLIALVADRLLVP